MSRVSKEQTTTSFGYWVRRRRQALDLTQAELAGRVGCATVTISKIEQDVRRPSRELATLLAYHLDISADVADLFVETARAERSVDRLPLKLSAEQKQSDSAPRSNLPVPVDAFVGREIELAELEQLILDPSNRLITIVGPGGMGKTRLALAAAKAQLEGFETNRVSSQ